MFCDTDRKEKHYKWITQACFIHDITNIIVPSKCLEIVRARKNQVTSLQQMKHLFGCFQFLFRSCSAPNPFPSALKSWSYFTQTPIEWWGRHVLLGAHQGGTIFAQPNWMQKVFKTEMPSALTDKRESIPLRMQNLNSCLLRRSKNAFSCTTRSILVPAGKIATKSP